MRKTKQPATDRATKKNLARLSHWLLSHRMYLDAYSVFDIYAFVTVMVTKLECLLFLPNSFFFALAAILFPYATVSFIGCAAFTSYFLMLMLCVCSIFTRNSNNLTVILGLECPIYFFRLHQMLVLFFKSTTLVVKRELLLYFRG